MACPSKQRGVDLVGMELERVLPPLGEPAIDEAPPELEQRQPDQAERPLGRRRAVVVAQVHRRPRLAEPLVEHAAIGLAAPRTARRAVRAASVSLGSRTSLVMIVVSTSSGTSPSVTPSRS